MARAEAAEKAIETKDNTPSAEMEQMVGEAIEEAESAARDAKDECARLQTETNRLHAELDAATTEKKVPEKKGKAAATAAAAKEDTASPPPAAKRTRRGGS